MKVEYHRQAGGIGQEVSGKILKGSPVSFVYSTSLRCFDTKVLSIPSAVLPLEEVSDRRSAMSCPSTQTS